MKTLVSTKTLIQAAVQQLPPSGAGVYRNYRSGHRTRRIARAGMAGETAVEEFGEVLALAAAA